MDIKDAPQLAPMTQDPEKDLDSQGSGTRNRDHSGSKLRQSFKRLSFLGNKKPELGATDSGQSGYNGPNRQDHSANGLLQARPISNDSNEHKSSIGSVFSSLKHPGSRSRSTSNTSSFVPEEVAQVPELDSNSHSRSKHHKIFGSSSSKSSSAEGTVGEARVIDWEKNAQFLGLSSNGSQYQEGAAVATGSGDAKVAEETLQRAIDLHEEGNLEESTQLFRVLADPKRDNHPLAQVLYGLSLRHGWGCAQDEQAAFYYLRLAASNSALQASLTSDSSTPSPSSSTLSKSTKGELVLAIYELGNCFKHGWGCEKDSYAAKTYFETAARLGDPDAMVDTADCYMGGFGTKKNKFQAAQYLRMAEKAGKKEVGNSWIWKDKYDAQ